MNNKRTIFASRFKPRWAPASNHGRDFIDVISDPNYLFKKTLEPLDKQPVQSEAFKRTTLAPNQFKSEQGSVIWRGQSIGLPLLCEMQSMKHLLTHIKLLAKTNQFSCKLYRSSSFSFQYKLLTNTYLDAESTLQALTHSDWLWPSQSMLAGWIGFLHLFPSQFQYFLGCTQFIGCLLLVHGKRCLSILGSSIPILTIGVAVRPLAFVLVDNCCHNHWLGVDLVIYCWRRVFLWDWVLQRRLVFSHWSLVLDGSYVDMVSLRGQTAHVGMQSGWQSMRARAHQLWRHQGRWVLVNTLCKVVVHTRVLDLFLTILWSVEVLLAGTGDIWGARVVFATFIVSTGLTRVSIFGKGVVACYICVILLHDHARWRKHQISSLVALQKLAIVLRKWLVELASEVRLGSCDLVSLGCESVPIL